MRIKSTKEYVPDMKFDMQKGEVWIEGESYHEYTSEVFKPVFEWIEKYTTQSGRPLVLNFKLSYFNTSSARIFLEIMLKLEEYRLQNSGNTLVNWYYDKTDIDMLDSGEKYAEDIDVPFNLIPY